jgi:ABC-2 type transport system ATP-binding protein
MMVAIVAAMEPIIRVQHLTKRYKKAERAAVDDISFDVGAGELFAFLGPNGAGKTTTISILTTTLAKTSGRSPSPATTSTTSDRRPAQHRDHLPEPERRPAPVGEENIRLHVALYGIYGYRPFYRAMPAAYRQRIEQLAEVVGLGDELHKPLKTFSGGMKRKLEIIRSLMHRPGCCSSTSRRRAWTRQPAGLWAYLRDVRNQDGTTVFLTTHYLDEAEDADRVCVIDHGRSACWARPTT